MDTNDIFKLIIPIGKDIENDITPSEPAVDSLKPYYRINMVDADYIKAARLLSNSDLIALLKGLTYVEGKLKWSGGSVATGKYLFGILIVRRDWHKLEKEKFDQVFHWIMDNLKNDFWYPKYSGSDFQFG